MDIKVWLNRGNKINERIFTKEEQIEMWRSLASKVTACYEQSSGGSSALNKLEYYIAKCSDMELTLGGDLAELIDTKAEITEFVRKMKDPVLSLLLENRYLLGKSWETIAEELNYTGIYIRELHGKALSRARKLKEA